jgi:hypothetical protein
MATGRRRTIPPRMQRTIWFAGSAIAIAIVLAMGGVLALPQKAPETDGGSGRSAKNAGDADYKAALSSLASGETTKALELLRSAAAAGNAAAQSKLDELTGKPGGSSPATQGPPTDDLLAGKVKDVAALLPSAVPGYRASEVEVSELGAILPLEPTYEGPFGKVTVVVMTVLDKKTETGARDYVAQIERAYPRDGESVRIGSYSGRFGTDGSRLAAVVFSRGRYVFEVVATASRPGPTAVKDIALAAAATFPAAR